MTLSPGTRIRRYEVSELLGAGGMGEVYLARDVELDRPVALKVLPHTETAHDEQIVHRFLQEAKAAISLSHPNVAHIYDAGDENGVRFLAMEYVQGETLRARIARGQLPLDDALEIMLQVASALASAHAAGIVHRDAKPENVMLRPDGYVKVLDFGLAKLTVRDQGPESVTQVVRTEPGVVMGTMHYMSPEQLRGSEVDARADVFSLGVMLYELVSGHRPFEASTPSGVIAAILTEEPEPPDDAPAGLRAVIAKALAKNPNDRYASARELGAALKKARGDTHRIKSGDVPTQVVTRPVDAPRKPHWKIAAAALVLLAIAAIGAWLFARQKRIADARAKLPQVEQLAQQERYFEAWDLATSLHHVLGNEEQLTRALQKMSEELTVSSDPPGARVYLERVRADGSLGPRVLAGTTPLAKFAFARGNYILTIEKDGYAARRRPLSAAPLHIAGTILQPPLPPLQLKLQRSGDVPAGMVHVDGGPYALTGWLPVTEEKVTLDPFFIDRYEVSNREFEQFVRAGGYRRRELWKHPFLKDGNTLRFEEAMALFRDATGLPGPRSWAQGKYPQGRENHPVTDITWYEAAAYAEHAGKQLPTIYQWDKAARNGGLAWAGSVLPWGMIESGADITPRTNFRGAGPMPVDSLPSGMSVWGAHHFAGNVAELLRNRLDDGFAATGGGFDDQSYQFGAIASYPGFFSSPQLGFRCVRETSQKDQGTFDLATNRVKPVLPEPASDAEFARLRAKYDYERTPLLASVIERIDTPDWVREKIRFTGARGRTAFAYLYLPKGIHPPFQVVHFVPAGDVWNGRRTLAASMDLLGGVIRGGRAAFGVVLEGFLERPAAADAAEANELAEHVIDLRRGLDYLTSRPDVDPDKIAYLNPSAGSIAYILTAVDGRHSAVALIGSSYTRSLSNAPEKNPPNFLPRIRAPKVVIHGKHDEVNPLVLDGQPVYELMRGQKELRTYDGGHIPSKDSDVSQLIAFFDKHLGPPS